MCAAEMKPSAMKTTMRAAVFFAGLVLGSSAFAQPRPTEPLPQDRRGPPLTALSAQDRSFIRTAMEAGHTEVILGKLAQEKSSNEEIRKFGARMVKDHSKAGEELKAIAARLGYKPPASREAKKKEDVITMLKDLSGDEFNLAYSKTMVKAHQDAVSLFREHAKEDGAPELRQFAQKTLPVLREHLKMARTLPPVKKAAQKWKK
jgi:putative membrane protein